ncbi:MAG: methionine--tRNA ligase, partial [Chloroflexota bacterium]
SPAQVVERYHNQFVECWHKMGISFDLYTTTTTPNHARVAQDIFLSLLRKDYIYRNTVPQPYCPRCLRFLPDRYVEGTCPLCGSTGARGDQCDKCGKPLNPTDLQGPRCRLCGTTPEVRDTEHFFLRLSAFQEPLYRWIQAQTHWKPNVLNFSLRYLEEGLRDRAITRDISWGIPVPVAGFENKRIYVWFEAVIGYLSATMEWAGGDEAKWRPFWQEGIKSYYFIGKDNIPFHTLIWPAMLLGYGGLSLPYDVPANEFLTIQGRQLSTSRNWAVWLPDYLERYDPDPLRYYLSANMPESADTDFSWPEFYRRNNDELVATYGNLAHRVLTFVHRHYGGEVPQPGPVDAGSQALLDKAAAAFQAVDTALAACHFREGVRTAMALAQEGNRYLEVHAPWKSVETDREGTGTTLYVALSVISCLKTILYPYLPFSSARLHGLLGLEGAAETVPYEWQRPTPGRPLPPPAPLFTKLDEKGIEAEVARMGASR